MAISLASESSTQGTATNLSENISAIIGLAFQAQDWPQKIFLDVVGDSATLGKTAGSTSIK